MEPVSYDELKQMRERDEDFLLINVLPTEQFSKQHILGSISLPHEDAHFVELVEKVAGGKERTVVVYCANFDCHASTKAGMKLESADFRNVLEFEGGMEEWAEKENMLAALASTA